jgi:hypothetical protein
MGDFSDLLNDAQDLVFCAQEAADTIAAELETIPPNSYPGWVRSALTGQQYTLETYSTEADTLVRMLSSSPSDNTQVSNQGNRVHFFRGAPGVTVFFLGHQNAPTHSNTPQPTNA